MILYLFSNSVLLYNIFLKFTIKNIVIDIVVAHVIKAVKPAL